MHPSLKPDRVNWLVAGYTSPGALAALCGFLPRYGGALVALLFSSIRRGYVFQVMNF